MITSKLAKELKELGFPKKNTTGYIPDLGDLIDACGDGFFSLARDGSGQWRAMIEKQPLKTFKSDIDNTPDEAVANLFKEINKK